MSEELKPNEKEAMEWMQIQLEKIDVLESENTSIKCILKNLIQITDNVVMFAPNRKTDAYIKIKDEISKLK
jgi:hypothetical protein